jgi:hypothetical protein
MIGWSRRVPVERETLLKWAVEWGTRADHWWLANREGGVMLNDIPLRR